MFASRQDDSSSPARIKPNAAGDVKPPARDLATSFTAPSTVTLALLVAFALAPTPALAAPPARATRARRPAQATPATAPATPAPAEDKPAGDDDTGPVTPIEAKSFDLTVSRKSKSRRVYLFDVVVDGQTVLPRVGRILLLKKGGRAIMAFRVLKQYEDKQQFAAKRVKRYEGGQELPDGEHYDAIEKISDLDAPEPTANDRADINELEKTPKPPGEDGGDISVRAYDPELDAATSPPPIGSIDSARSEGAPPTPHPSLDDDDEELLGLAIEDVFPIDPYRQWLTGGFGFFRNSDGVSSGYYVGGGFRYGVNLAQMIFLRRQHVQDSLTLEGGLFYYKVLGLPHVDGTKNEDSAYSILPLIGTLRYNVLLNENFGIFFYGGLIKNVVTEVANGDEEVGAALGSTVPAAGVGLLFRVGPSWYTRVDLGYDVISASLVLRF